MVLMSQPRVSMTSVDFAFLQLLKEALCCCPNVIECDVASETLGTSVTKDIVT